MCSRQQASSVSASARWHADTCRSPPRCRDHPTSRPRCSQRRSLFGSQPHRPRSGSPPPPASAFKTVATTCYERNRCAGCGESACGRRSDSRGSASDQRYLSVEHSGHRISIARLRGRSEWFHLLPPRRQDGLSSSRQAAVHIVLCPPVTPELGLARNTYHPSPHPLPGLSRQLANQPPSHRSISWALALFTTTVDRA